MSWFQLRPHYDEEEEEEKFKEQLQQWKKTEDVCIITSPLQHTKRPALQNKRVAVLEMAFRAQNVFRAFEKWATGLVQ